MARIEIISQEIIAEHPLKILSDDFILMAYYCPKDDLVINFPNVSIYGFVQQGEVSLGSHIIPSKHYFSYQAATRLKASRGSYFFVIQAPKHYKALNTIGGPIEETGRLKYIDGCSDTLLISPPLLGDPCLNFLHFPTATKQTMHHHPSFRFGMVSRGKGKSITLDSIQQLDEGDIFYIPALLEHKFDTHQSSMDVIAFHPDSDWGPTDEMHPMINRTWLNGKKI